MRRAACTTSSTPRPLDDAIWQQAKLHYIGLLDQHKQPELAETFFNSVFCRILHRTYFHNDFIFVRPAISTEYIESDPPTYRCYYPREAGCARCAAADLSRLRLAARPFADLDRDVDSSCAHVQEHFDGESAATRGRTSRSRCSARPSTATRRAYVIGKVVNGATEYPFAVPVLHDADGRARSSTRSCSTRGASACCSRSRAPTSWSTWRCRPATSSSCAALMPNKPRSELYTDARARQAGQDALLPRPAPPPAPFGRTSSSSRRASAAWSCWCSRCRPTRTCSR